ncbi:MAG: carboxypeptidase regulatory-like domain-containing protein [Bryobacteraceae bacterium]|nr:carboxypeptidase regulatory-like domain-containing protein [Bryobacteraceae bacterium]
MLNRFSSPAALGMAAILAFALLLVPAAWPQQYYGALTGTVTDPTGSVLRGVTVTLTNLNKNTATSARTNDEGIYRALDLTPDMYKLEVEFTGFKKYVREPIRIESNRNVTLDVQMELGEVTQTVEVTGAPPLLEAERSQTTQTFEGSLVMQAPLDVNARSDMRTILSYLPGANYGFSGRMLINGARSAQVAFDNDGLANRSPWAGNMQQEASYNVDSLAGVKMTLVNAGAESRASAQVSLVSRSGTNAFHGNVFLDTVHSIFNANDHNVPEGADKSFYRTNYEGYTISGPVYIPKIYDGRNRTFFMSSLALNQTPGGPSGYLTTPSAAMRSGDFSDFRDPSGELIPIVDPTTGEQFPGNRIPASRLFAGAKNYLDAIYPLPDQPGYERNKYMGELWYGNIRSARLDLRVDQVVTPKNNFFVRYNTRFEPSDSGYREFGVGFSASQFTIDSVAVTDSHIFRPNLLNEFRAGVSRVKVKQFIENPARRYIDLLGIQGIPSLFLTEDRRSIPDLWVTGMEYIYPWTQDGKGGNRLWEFFDNATLIHNRHTLKFGTNFRKDVTEEQFFGVPGAWTFDGTFSGYGVSDFLLGLPHTATRPYPRALLGNDRKSAWYMGWWLQDDFKVSPRLTVNLGLRWDVNFPATAAGDTYYNFDPQSGALVLPSQQAIDSIVPVFPKTIPITTVQAAGFPERLRSTRWRYFAPRIGLAWRPWDEKTVIRTAYGIYTNELSLAYLLSLTYSSPWGGSETFTNAFQDSRPQWSWPAAFPTNVVGDSSFGGTYSAGGFTPDLKNPYTQQWNFTIERQIEAMLVRLQYVGTKSTHLLWLRGPGPYGTGGDYNTPPPSTTPFDPSRRPYPEYGTINYLENGGDAIYHALNVGVERRLSNGVTFNSQFTWARNMTDTYDGGTDIADLRYDFGLGNTVWNRRGMRGNQPETPKLRFTTLAWGELPIGRGRLLGRTMPRVLDAVIGGWALSGNLNIETGWWFSPYYWGGTDPSGTNYYQGAPDIVGQLNFRNTNLKPYDMFINPAAFVLPADNIGRFGNSGLTFLQEPTWWVVDMGFHKTIPIREQMRFELACRMQNAFNHGYYWHRSLTYQMDVNNPATFGQFQGWVNGSRVISLVGRFAW